MIYLDHNATAPLRPSAAEAIAAAGRAGGNPSSLHAVGQRARQRLEAACDAIRALVGAESAQVVLTSGGTEADNLMMLGAARARRQSHGAQVVVVSELEHPAVQESAALLAADGFTLRSLEIAPNGQVNPETVELGDDVAIVAVMLANNETGILQPVGDIAARARSAGVPLHCDAVQAAGKIPIDFDALGVTSLALSAHKFGGPRGVGALVMQPGTAVEPLWQGGGQQDGLRSGTPAVALITGMGTAAKEALDHVEAPGSPGPVAQMRDSLESRLLQITGCFVIGSDVPRLPNTCAIGFEGVPAQKLVGWLSEHDIVVGAGAACHGHNVTPSAVLLAMGLPAERALEVVRLSFGFTNEIEDVDRACSAIVAAVEALR